MYSFVYTLRMNVMALRRLCSNGNALPQIKSEGSLVSYSWADHPGLEFADASSAPSSAMVPSELGLIVDQNDTDGPGAYLGNAEGAYHGVSLNEPMHLRNADGGVIRILPVGEFASGQVGNADGVRDILALDKDADQNPVARDNIFDQQHHCEAIIRKALSEITHIEETDDYLIEREVILHGSSGQLMEAIINCTITVKDDMWDFGIKSHALQFPYQQGASASSSWPENGDELFIPFKPRRGYDYGESYYYNTSQAKIGNLVGPSIFTGYVKPLVSFDDSNGGNFDGRLAFARGAISRAKGIKK